MKNLIQSLVVGIILGGSIAQAQDFGMDESLATFQKGSAKTAEILRWNIDDKATWIAQDKVVGGNISIDTRKKEITLMLYRHSHCPVNLICTAAMPAPFIVKLPLVGAPVKDSCGTKIYTALRDARPVDGGLEQIQVRDNTSNHCPTFVPMADTDVVYETESAGFGAPVLKTRSTFEAARLEKLAGII